MIQVFMVEYIIYIVSHYCLHFIYNFCTVLCCHLCESEGFI